MGGGKGGMILRCGIDPDKRRIGIERDVEAAGIVHLRDEADVGEADPVAIEPLPGGARGHVFQRGEGFGDPVAIPVVAVDLDERERLVADLGTKTSMLLRNHGTLTVGKTVGEAFLRMYFLERACEAQIYALSAGADISNPPQGTPEVAAAQGLATIPIGANLLAWPALKRKAYRLDPSFAT